MVMIYKLNRFGLGNDDGPLQGRARVRGTTGGFVDLGNEHEYAAGGHQASGANEIFADVQGDRPWFVLISLCICISLLIAYYFQVANKLFYIPTNSIWYLGWSLY
jgi:hypothetical protein